MIPLGPRFPHHEFSSTQVSETAGLKDKLTIAQGMVPLLVTLPDLQTRHAGLSAPAEVLVVTVQLAANI